MIHMHLRQKEGNIICCAAGVGKKANLQECELGHGVSLRGYSGLQGLGGMC